GSLIEFLITGFVYAITSELYGYLLARPLQLVYANSLKDSLDGYIKLEFQSFREIGVGKILATIDRRSISTGELISVSLNYLLPVPFFLTFMSYRVITGFKIHVFLFVFFFVFIYTWLTISITKYRTKLRKETNERINILTNLGNEILSNYETVKAFNIEEYEMKRYEKKLGDIVKPASRLWQGLYLLNMIQKVVLYLMDVVIVTFLVVWGKSDVVRLLTEYTCHSASLKRKLNNLESLYGIFLLSTTNIMTSYVLPENNDKSLRALKSFDKKISFDNNLNFSIVKNDKIAVVGSNGSGKTTFIRILLGFYEYKGSIKVDSMEQKRGFEEKSNKNDLEVMEVSKKYGVQSSLLRLENVYLTYVGERGKNLSGWRKTENSTGQSSLKG
ncbi:unnamed protein product, partial [Darwinula stevensoni]